jgi:sulfite exporter TauE/SafE
MLTSISPLGERARHNRWSLTVSAYVVGSMLAATLVGATLGTVGAALKAACMPRPAAAALLAACALVAVLTDSGFLRLPTIHRQVNEDWLNQYRGWVYGAGYGFQLGAGIVTIVTSAAVYLTLAGELLVGSVAGGALIGATFGAMRAVPLLALGRPSTHEQLVARHRKLVALAPVARGLTVAVTGGVFLVFLGSTLASVGARL